MSVKIQHPKTKAVGTCPDNAVEKWVERGWERVDNSTPVTDPIGSGGVQDTGTFDPSAEGVTARQVSEYLAGLDQETDEGKAEYDRVVAAEKAGQNRSTAIPTT